MIKLLMGGSPCTHWSIAQTKNRETEPSGLGWELFKNYLIGLEKYNPNYFLYENNKSMSPAIRTQITKELGVEPILINSSLVSAQNRQRLYWTNIPGVTQPEDRGILLRDVLDCGTAWREKAYTIDAHYYKTPGEYNPKKQHSYSRHQAAEPVCVAQRGRPDGAHYDQQYEPRGDGKTNALTTVQKDNMVAEPVRIGTIANDAKNADHDSQQYRVYSPDGKAVTLCGNGGGVGAKTGLYACPAGERKLVRLGGLYEQDTRWGIWDVNGIAPTLTASMGMGGGHIPMVSEQTDEVGRCQKNPTTGKNIYEVRDGMITIKGKQYPIKLPDGFYIIRKLTVLECMRLQTVPDDYIFPVSNTQAYKMLGNGWTVDVIAHILSFIPGIQTQPVEVLGMYDGMSCGHIALDKLGANVVRYYASEIDKYAIQTTQTNYPETIHLGDAFQVREDGWVLQDQKLADAGRSA